MVQKTYFKTKEHCKVKFTYNGGDAQTVEVFGLNGDWQTPIELKKKKDGTFSTEVSLPKGSQHEFKYRVNGNDWINEPEADSQGPDTFGGHNSIITL
ncbi:isoamylase early set domain-containing protein [Paraflavisolibacter sp. H34]|uniref:isoamylase early set domain-containing protein n=1 Tax=Huijunlia imazamoxiresistens TaxID=3127457 RepID=UPI003019DEEA